MSKRTPSMYSFYEREIKEAIETQNWERYDELVDDLPVDIRDTLIRQGVLEESVDQSREEN
jgi:hypothetical protein